uniref:Uncharacterized protein n=1 Tax=Timema douglasi TaxID=61478 RepID=A0A7R8VSX2_TIMDO|nr:unnamed protein product [Timema douglasi]
MTGNEYQLPRSAAEPTGLAPRIYPSLEWTLTPASIPTASQWPVSSRPTPSTSRSRPGRCKLWCTTSSGSCGMKT